MLHPPTIWHSLLEGLLSLSARVSLQGSGSWWQAGLLRALGATVVGPVAIAPGSSFLGARQLRLGRYVTIGEGSRIVAWGSVEIGDDFMASDRLNINSGSHDPVTLAPRSGSIRIGHRVWCGAGVTICADVVIGDDVVIGAHSLVTRSLPAGCIAYGSPAKPVRALDRPPPARVWSMWPERAAGGHLENAPLYKRRLHWLLARL